MSDLHELVLRWPHPANKAIVTGTFDQWACSVHMIKTPSGFTATVRVPWEEKVLYKFIIDGDWANTDQAPTEPDWRGNINNVYRAPTKPKDIDTPRHETPAIMTTPVRVPAQPVEDATAVAPPVPPAPVVPVNDTKLVDTPSKAKDVAVLDTDPAVQSTPVNPAPPSFVPLNDRYAVFKQPSASDPSDDPHPPSTHALPVNSPRKDITGMSPPTLPPKKEEEKTGPKPEGEQPNGTTNSIISPEPAQRPPTTPTKSDARTVPMTPPKSNTSGIPTTPTTPKKSHLSGSTPSSPTSSSSKTTPKKGAVGRKHTILSKIKHVFKKGHGRAKSDG